MFKLKKKQSLIYLALFIFLLLILSSSVSFLRPVLLNTLKAPLYAFEFVKREIKGIIFYHRNMVQNERLRQESDILIRRLNQMNEVMLEDKRLKELLSFKQKSGLKVIAARVIGRPADNWASGIIIDKGSAHGIKRGYVVINFLGLIGRVVENDFGLSKVMLINDTNFSVSGLVQRSRQEGLISGTLGNSLTMRYLPRDADIRIGDTIVTSGLTEIFPKGILIGSVIELGDEFSGLSRYALVRPAVNLSNVEEVLVIIP